ncbi:MAG: NfeD family protein [Aggregatilineales bacterium]
MIDPNLTYLLLVLGLWASVFGLYVPGTGFVELLAGVAMIGAFLALAANPATNWLFVVLLGAGVLSYMLLPLYRREWARAALLGLVGQAIGGLFLFADTLTSPVLIALTVGISFGLYQLVLVPFHRKQISQPTVGEDELLEGAQGYVVKALEPVGTVNVNSELWTAYSNEALPSGTPVRVVSKEGLRLFVERTKPKHKPRLAEVTDESPPDEPLQTLQEKDESLR